MSSKSVLRTGLIVLLFCLGLMALPMIVGAMAPAPGAEGAAPLVIAPSPGADGVKLLDGGAQVRVTGMSNYAYTIYVSSTCHSGETSAGLFNIQVLSPSGSWNDSLAYCADLCHTVIYNTVMNSCGDTSSQIAYILANYYPATTAPSAATTNARKAAAVQAAIWYFSNGATLTSATHDQIETATAAIIADANAHSGSVTVVPDSLTLTPASETNNTNFEATHTVTATLMGSNGLPMSGQTIHFRTTSGSNNPSLSYDGTTNASGQCSWTYTNTGGAGTDSIQAYTNNFTTPRGLQFCYPERQMIVLAGAPQSFRAEATASKKWISCPDYDVTLLSYTVNCTTNKTEFIYKVQGNGGSGTSLSHWSLELCSGLPTSISGYEVYKSSSCTNPVWTLMTGSTREYKAAGSANNDMTDACGLSVPSLKINEGVDKNGCEAFKIVINGLWGTTAVHWAGKGGSDGAGGTCQYCEGGVTGPSCTPYTVPCSLDGPSSGCAGQSLTYTYTGGATGVTFKWYVDNVEQAGQTASSFNWTATSGSHTIKLRVTDANGCYNECSLPVTGNPPPACGISGPSAGCVSEPLTFNYSGGSTGVTFQWFVNNVLQASTGSSLNWTPGAPGSYTIKLIVTAANGCSSECSVTTSIAAPPTVSAAGAEVCVASPAQLTASANDCATMTYIWYKGGVQVGTGATLSFASTTLDNAGVYTVVGTCTATGCSASATATLTVHPYPDVTLSNQTTCLGEPTTLASSMVALGDCDADEILYTWSQWNGSAWVVIAGEDEASLSFTPSAVGSFRYKVQACCASCCDEAEATVTVVSRDIVVHKYYDLDQNGEYDSEEMLAGWTFTLYDEDDNVVDTQTTNASGLATFSGLPVGEYRIVETVKPLWASSTGAEETLTLTCDGGTAHVWFGNYELCNLTATLSGGGSCLCLSNPPTLLVDTTGSICAGTLHYEWFLDGVKITTAPDAPSYQPIASGSYTVKVSCVATSGPLCDVTTNAQSVSFDFTNPTWDQTMPEDMEGVECDRVPDAPTGFTASDNCDPSVDVDFDEDITPGSCPDSYTLTRTWTATDNCGNSISWTQTIEVVDTTDPTLSSKPADVTVECNAVPSVPVITASDNCDEYVPVQFSETRQDGLCDDSYTLVRTWTATDDCGNSDSHTQYITVRDTTPPSWVVSSLPDPDTVYAECDAVPDFPPDPIATDNCSTPLVVRSEEKIYQQGACLSNYVLVVTWTATDDCLNEITFSYYIVVRDTTKPLISCPPIETVQCRADVSAPDITKVTASDNCGAVVVTWQGDVSDGNSCPETITRTYRATDECGNWAECTQTIVVDDTINPTITCPAGVTVQCLADVPDPDAASIIATDNCGVPTVTWEGDVSDGNSCPETITRTYRATDACGNYVECTQTIVVDDTIDPYWVSVLPQDRTVECNAIPPKPSVLVAGDNCDANVSVTLDEDVEDGECEDSYIIIYTWTATDDCGNSIEHTQRITVQDTTDPVLSEEPEDVTVECNAVPGAPTITATDNCDGDVPVQFSETRQDGDCPSNYILTRTWVATDDCGNMVEHTQTITVQDTTDPIWSQDMPEDETVECNAVPGPAILTATDNCDDAVTVTYNQIREDGYCTYFYTLVRTWTAVDDCGNSITHTQRITVQDNQNPTWDQTMPTDVTVECDNVPGTPDVTASDTCDADVDIAYSQRRTDGDCPDYYILTRVWVAVDDCGNTIRWTQNIVVRDTTAPTWSQNMPGDVTVECDAVPEPPEGITATDNCGDVIVTYDEVRQDGDCANGYTLTRTWVAEDECNNQTTHIQVITVVDMTPPEITCAEDVLVCADQNLEAVIGDYTAQIIASDNCSLPENLTVIQTPAAGTVVTVPVGQGSIIVPITFTVVDECGNESECEISFEVRTGDVIVNKYEDLDADGVKDLSEQPLAGWTMTLVDAEGNVVASGVTDANGQVFFDNLGCGVYTVTETLQDGWVNVTPIEQTVTVVMDETAEVTFGNFHCMTVFGYKWKDYDGDGVWDADEPAIYNWTIELSNGQKTTTDMDGKYSFTICVPGDYTVSEAMPDGWEASTPTEVDFRASSGEEIGPINFGNRQLFGGGGVMGSKFWDENGNGVWDAGEATIAGIKIIIRDDKGDEVFQTTTINAPGAPAHGAWKCEQGLPPGIYTVEEVVPDGWVATYPAVNGNVYKIEILDDGTFKLLSEEPSWYTNLSFGNGRLMGYKWYDINENGQYDTGEEKLANWRILVKDMNYNVVLDAKTNSAGYWFMPKLAEGDYYVVEEPQEGWTQVYPTDFNGAFKIHLYSDGSYDLLSPAQPWFEGLNFGNVRTGGVPGECPLCPEWVVFQSNRSDEDPMNTEIYKMRFDGTDVRRLTNEPGEDVQPTWSFDGTRIAFTSMRDGDWEIYRMGAHGGTGVNVTKFPNAADMNPSWACYWIAFQTNRDGNWEIYKTDPEGIQQIRLTDNPADDTAPAWSPDGRGSLTNRTATATGTSMSWATTAARIARSSRTRRAI